MRLARDRREVEDDLVSGRLKGVVVLASDFTDRLGRGETAPIQVLVDGSDPNTAGLVQFYIQGLWANWLLQEAASHENLVERPKAAPLVRAEPRVWFNPNLNSRYALLPGAVAVVLTLIGTLLTSLVVAREWERGTMEALLATPISPIELIVGKVVPYFVLGMGAMALSVSVTVFLLGVPFRGSILALMRAFVGLPGGDAGARPVDIDRDSQPVRGQPGGVDRGVLAGFRAFGIHLRDRQHGPADTALDVRAAPALLRLELADLVPRRRRDERPGTQLPGALGDGRCALHRTCPENARAPGVVAMWLRIRSLIIKELLAIWRDPKSRFILLGPPVIELLIFAYAATQEVKNVNMAVLNQDMGIYARDLVARFEGSSNFRSVRHLAAEPEVAPAIDSRSVLLVLCIREDFSRLLAVREPAAVQLILDGRSSNTSQILAGYAEAIIDGYNAELAQARARRRRRRARWWLESGSTPTRMRSGARCPPCWRSWWRWKG